MAQDHLKLLVDTNVFIDCLKGLPRAKSFFQSLDPAAVYFSTITLAELLAGAKPEEESMLEIFLSPYQSLPVDHRVATRAAAYLREFGHSHGVRIADALIAASAGILRGE